MKKTILILCAVMISSFLVFTNSSSAAGGWRGPHQDRGKHHRSWQKPSHYKPGRAWGHHPKRHHYRPARVLRNKHHRLHRRPFHRQYHPGRHHSHLPGTVVREVNNYYGSSESYDAYEDSRDQFNFSTSVSETGFSFSIGVERTD